MYCPAKTNRIVGWGKRDGEVKNGGVGGVDGGCWSQNGVEWALGGEREYLEGGGRGEGKEVEDRTSKGVRDRNAVEK